MKIKSKIQDYKEGIGKNQLIVGIGLLVVLLPLILALNSSDQSPDSTSSTSWRETELRDISTGENYSISELEKPILVETFAVWCPTCTNQQQQLKEFHNSSNVTSVSLDVDPNENKEKAQNHIDRYGFDWRYSVALASMTRQLIQEYGNSIAQPPVAPMILVCENGTRRLPNGVKTPSKLGEEVEKGC